MLIYYLDPKLVSGEPLNALAGALASSLSLVGIETEVIIQGGTRAEIDGKAISSVTQRVIDKIAVGLSHLQQFQVF